MAKHKVTITVMIDPAEYSEPKGGPATAVDIAAEAIRGQADWVGTIVIECKGVTKRIVFK